MGRTACSMDWGEVLLHSYLAFIPSPRIFSEFAVLLPIPQIDQVFDQLRRKELQTLGNRLKCTVFK